MMKSEVPSKIYVIMNQKLDYIYKGYHGQEAHVDLASAKRFHSRHKKQGAALMELTVTSSKRVA